MKYVVTLNGKKYDVEVNESEAVITSVSNAAPVAPVAPAAPVAAPAPAASTAPGAPAAVVGTAVSGTQITSPTAQSSSSLFQRDQRLIRIRFLQFYNKGRYSEWT